MYNRNTIMARSLEEQKYSTIIHYDFSHSRYFQDIAITVFHSKFYEYNTIRAEASFLTRVDQETKDRLLRNHFKAETLPIPFISLKECSLEQAKEQIHPFLDIICKIEGFSLHTAQRMLAFSLHAETKNDNQTEVAALTRAFAKLR